jgi:molybdopterin molybdotransferase
VREGISPAQALEIVLAEAPLLPAETVAAGDGLGRVLAESIASGRRLPPDDNSAMDGYAVRAADTAGASPAHPVEIEVAFEVAAGARPEKPLEPGRAARIFTGAALPPGADAVVRQEDAERAGGRLRLRAAAAPRQNVRDAGEDVEIGERVLEPGTVLRAAHLGLLASLGRSAVSVRQRARVAILSGGDELVEPDADVAGGRIVASNSYSIAAQCRELGAEPVYLGIARDSREDVEAHLRPGLSADVLVSSAGVSVGDRDHVRPALEALGFRLSFWGVNMKPGYPLVFGRHGAAGRPLVFGLPGNPVSAMVTFELFVRPCLLRMMGHTALFRPRVRARLDAALRKPAGRFHFVRVALERRGAEIAARPTGNQSSGVLRSMVAAHGLLLFPAEATELSAGATVEVLVLDPDFLAAADSGL